MLVYTYIYIKCDSMENMKKHVHKLIKLGTHSRALVIPTDILDKYGWRTGQKIVIKDLGRGKLEVRDWRSK